MFKLIHIHGDGNVLLACIQQEIVPGVIHNLVETFDSWMDEYSRVSNLPLNGWVVPELHIRKKMNYPKSFNRVVF